VSQMGQVPSPNLRLAIRQNSPQLWGPRTWWQVATRSTCVTISVTEVRQLLQNFA